MSSSESKVIWKQYRDYLLHLARLRSRGRLDRLRQRIPMTRLFRFGIVGLSGLMVDMTLLYVLSDPTMLGLALTRSKILASEAAIVNNFFWNDRWTFGDISRRQTGFRTYWKRFLKFNLICLAGVVMNVLLLNLFFNGFGINRYVANLMAIALVTTWNFWINLKLNWRVTNTP